MFEIQKLLQDQTYDEISEELGIKFNFHPTLPLVICNYDQIKSQKTHPVVRECRGLILHSQSFELVARSFRRFFNWGEVHDEMKLFNFDNFSGQTKEDGSLSMIYNWQDNWYVSTRGSFALDNMQYQSFTWQDAILQAVKTDLKHLNPELTYVGEFCSPWNKVVRTYKEPTFYLLSAFNGYDELNPADADAAAAESGLLRPETHNFSSMSQIEDFITQISVDDPTFEGVVIRDDNNHRWKVKSPSYFGLHQLKGEGDNLWNPKYLMPFVVNGESAELLNYFEEVKPALDYYTQQTNDLYNQMMAVWDQAKGIEDQKEFALLVKNTPLASILFTARKQGENPEKVFRESQALILKKINKYHELDSI